MPESPVLLKRGHARTVELEGGVVLKRFHHPHPLYALRDAARARAEVRALERLHAAGFPVPEPLGIERRDGHPVVRMRGIPGAVSLEELLAPRGACNVDWDRLCPRLGELFARLASAPVRHADLHPGNVLVDERGDPWLVDFHAAQSRKRPPSGPELLRELVRMNGFAREVVPARARLRFLVTWLETLEPSQRASVQLPRLTELEELARVERREFLRHAAGRWLRDSSRARVLPLEGGEIVHARRTVSSEHELLFESSWNEARARWLAAARLVEHGLPCAPPVRLVRVGRRARAVFARALPEGVAAASRWTVPELARDRGLTIAPVTLVDDGRGRRVLVPPLELVRNGG